MLDARRHDERCSAGPGSWQASTASGIRRPHHRTRPHRLRRLRPTERRTAPGYGASPTGPAPGYGGPPAPGNYTPSGERVGATLLDALFLFPLWMIAAIPAAAAHVAIGLLLNTFGFAASLYFA